MTTLRDMKYVARASGPPSGKRQWSFIVHAPECRYANAKGARPMDALTKHGLTKLRTEVRIGIVKPCRHCQPDVLGAVQEAIEHATARDAELRERIRKSTVPWRLEPPPDLVIADARWSATYGDWHIQTVDGRWFYLRPEGTSPWQESHYGPTV